MKTIVALVDLSDLTFKVLKQAHSMARAFMCEVIILNVLTKEPVTVDLGIVSPTILQAPSAEDAQKHCTQLLEMRDSLLKFGVSATVQQSSAESVDDLLEETQKLGADMMILGTHHHSTIYDLFIGSFANDVLKRAHCPVLVVPSNETEETK